MNDDILITGGTGSFGRAFVRMLLPTNPVHPEQNPEHPRIIIYSRDELKQWNMRQEFADHPRLRFFIGDVRDQQRLRRALYGVHTVVHAAALKRIEVGAYCADEMIKTNVVGSMNVVEAARDAGVKKVIGLSTDKAWRGGVSPYGHTKALVESLLIQANNMMTSPRFAVVRYGNIWKSNGSIVPMWQQMIKSGATEVPVTDPDCTRFFMFQSEAVELIIRTLETMRGGELVIPETLKAYRVGDLAEAMGVKMRVTGLPAWERKHEGLRDEMTSDIAPRMTIDELREALRHV